MSRGGTRALVSSRELKTKSKRHPHPRTAFGELVDNAMGQAKAANIWIDLSEEDRVLTVRDDGKGISPDDLKKMLGLGFSTASSEEIGEYGEGFKSSTMKLADDVLVLSQKKFRHPCGTKTMGRTVGFLSQTLHERDALEDLYTPYLYLRKGLGETGWSDATEALLESRKSLTGGGPDGGEATGNRRMISRHAYDHLYARYGGAAITEPAADDDERFDRLESALAAAFERIFGDDRTGSHVEMWNLTPGLIEGVESMPSEHPWKTPQLPGPDVRFACDEVDENYLFETSLREYLATVYSVSSAWPSTDAHKSFGIHVNGVAVRRYNWDELLYTGNERKSTKERYRPQGNGDESLGAQLRARGRHDLALLVGHTDKLDNEPGASRNTHRRPGFKPFGLLVCVAGRVVDVFNRDHINRKVWQKNGAIDRLQLGLGSCILVELPKGIKSFVTNTNKDGFQSTHAMGSFKKQILGQKLNDFCKKQVRAKLDREERARRLKDHRVNQAKRRRAETPPRPNAADHVDRRSPRPSPRSPRDDDDDVDDEQQQPPERRRQSPRRSPRRKHVDNNDEQQQPPERRRQSPRRSSRSNLVVVTEREQPPTTPQTAKILDAPEEEEEDAMTALVPPANNPGVLSTGAESAMDLTTTTSRTTALSTATAPPQIMNEARVLLCRETSDFFSTGVATFQ
ncbi:hypothetical protein CTAYLR_001804 [Chrysophaeum taylorii]|uniref:Uncharacterized protein n=1 Tax=Chrysophaeum taylorii TaxID=2483200 RepID=A0AAD7U880_9STRA|nr:hypothetical protein CTAYLR_001804 [Chrysophaeum taylorii]